MINKSSLLADRTGLEPATSAVTGRHSNQLNYRSVDPMKDRFPLRECKYSRIYQKTAFFLFLFSNTTNSGKQKSHY